MSDDQLTQAVHDLWVALATIWPPDRFSVGIVFGAMTGVALQQGLWLLSPFYGLFTTALFLGLTWAISLNAKARL